MPNRIADVKKIFIQHSNKESVKVLEWDVYTDRSLDPKPTANRAILTITLLNEVQKEYDLSTEEVQTFLTWFDERTKGNGLEEYAFEKKHGIKDHSLIELSILSTVKFLCLKLMNMLLKCN